MIREALFEKYFCGEYCRSEPGYLKSKNQKDFVSILVYLVVNRWNFRNIKLKQNGGCLKLES